MIRKFSIIISVCVLFAVSLSVSAQNQTPFFEKGTVVNPSVKGEINAYPVTLRTSAGNLLTIYTFIAPNTNSDGKIHGSISRDNGKTWSSPFLVLDLPKNFEGDPAVIVDGNRVLVYASSVIPPNKINKSEIWLASSEDEGKTWSSPVEIKTPYNYFVGKRHVGLKLKDGTLVMPASYDIWAQLDSTTPAKTEGEMDLKAGVMLSKDGINWTPHIDLHILVQKVTPFATNGVVEPAIVELADGSLYMLMRTGTTKLYESRSRDGGKTWDIPTPSSLTAHNTPASLWRDDKNPNEIIVIWNNSPRYRYPLSVSISKDGGRNWSLPKNVAESKDNLQIAYPGITQDKDGNFIATWQEQLPSGEGRAIRFARFNRAWVLAGEK